MTIYERAVNAVVDYLHERYVCIPERGCLGPYTAPANGKASVEPNIAPRG